MAAGFVRSHAPPRLAALAALAVASGPPRSRRLLASVQSGSNLPSSSSVAASQVDSAGSAMDSVFMEQALEEAQRAFEADEVPIGAVLVRDGHVLAAAHNHVERLHDASAHAEMLCMRAAAANASAWRLGATTLYCTLEPCPMCALIASTHYVLLVPCASIICMRGSSSIVLTRPHAASQVPCGATRFPRADPSVRCTKCADGRGRERYEASHGVGSSLPQPRGAQRRARRPVGRADARLLSATTERGRTRVDVRAAADSA